MKIININVPIYRLKLKVGHKSAFNIRTLVVIFFLVTPLISMSQNDNINWSSIQLQIKLSEKTTFNAKPIFRLDEDISNFQNASIDIFAKYNLGKGWSTQLTSRTWFIPNQKNRQFVWPDLAYSFTKGNIKVNNRIRYHLALDINGRKDPDFIRYIIQVAYSKGKVKPFIGVEPWFRLNGIEQWQRIRYILGVSWKLNDIYSLSFTYWKQESFNLEPMESTNVWLLNLLVKI